MDDSCVPVNRYGIVLLGLLAELTIKASVFITIYFAVNALFLPAGFGAACTFRPVHTTRTVVQAPAGVKPKVMNYCWQIEPFIR